MSMRKEWGSVTLTFFFASIFVLGQASAQTAVSTTTSYDAVGDIKVFSSFDSNWDEHLKHQAESIVSRGTIPVINWMPYKRTTPAANILEAIIDGKQDAYIETWIAEFKRWLVSYPADYQPKIALRFSHEFNDTAYAWSDKPNAMKAAWRYLHNKFTEAGVGDAVEWVWNMENLEVGSIHQYSQYYPGDDVVDWISINDYLVYPTTAEKFPNKPIMLVEVTTAEPHEALDISKIQDNYKSYPAIKSVVFFSTKKELGWAIELENHTGLAKSNNTVSDIFFAETPNDTTIISEQETVKEAQATKMINDDTNKISQANRPVVVGSELLAAEARGIKKMSKKMLRDWRLKGILPR